MKVDNFSNTTLLLKSFLLVTVRQATGLQLGKSVHVKVFHRVKYLNVLTI